MLVISSSVVLTEAASLPPGTPYIGWHNLVDFTNLTSDTAADGYPVTNLADPTTNVYWQGVGAVAQEIAAAVNSADDIDYAGIAGHNFGTAQIAVEVGYYNEASAWVSLAGPQIPPDDQPMMLAFTPQSRASVVVKLSEGDAAPRAAVLHVGKLLVLERGVVVDAAMPWMPQARKVTRINGVSASGQFLGSIITGAKVTWRQAFKHFTPAWFREKFVPFLAHARDEGKPFFYAWKPAAYPYEVVYLWTVADWEPAVDPVTDRFEIELSGEGIVT
jgi:hypothetical protein